MIYTFNDSQKSITIHNECEIRLTNIVTPNADGFNESVVFPNLENYPGSELIVFNRWGKIIYKSSSYANDWSPTDFSEGTYYYVLKKTAGVEHPAKEFHGTMTILK